VAFSSAKVLQLILCIADDDVALRVRKLQLGSAGYEVFVAPSGEAGLKALSRTASIWSSIVSATTEKTSGLEFADRLLPKGGALEVLLDTIACLLGVSQMRRAW